MHEETIGGFLDQLAARTPTPGGGGTAALHAAQAAALLAMVARYSDGPKYAAQANTISWVVSEADRLRAVCTQLIAADADAFGSVAAAYKLPKGTAELTATRSAAIAAALTGATEAPAAVIAAAARLLDLAEALQPIGNRTVMADLAAAAEAIRAAIATARINVEFNLSGITDAGARDRFAPTIGAVNQLETRAMQVVAAVRAELAP